MNEARERLIDSLAAALTPVTRPGKTMPTIIMWLCGAALFSVVTPAECSVAAQATMMNQATIAANRQPTITSHREARYCLIVTPFSTTEACR